MPIIDDNETLQMFIEESKEHMDGVENDLLLIESHGADIDSELVNKVFRAVHSIKGGAGFLGLETIKHLAHGLENLLNMVRNRDLVPTPEVVSILLAAADELTSLINEPFTSNDVDVEHHIEALQNVATGNLAEAERKIADSQVLIRDRQNRELFSVTHFDLEQVRKGGRTVYLVEYDLLSDIERKGKTPLGVIREMQQTGVVMESKVDIDGVGTLQDSSDSMRIPFFVAFATVLEPDIAQTLLDTDSENIIVLSDEVLADMNRAVTPAAPASPVVPEPAVEPEAVPEPVAEPVPSPSRSETTPVASEAKPKTAATDEPQKKSVVAGSRSGSLRVNVNVLDQLMTLAGELVLTRNQLLQTVDTGDSTKLETTSQRVDIITSELQEAIMSTRMQPIGNIFHKFQRIVRDMSRNLGKEIELKISGEEVELDKTIIEAIGDPLTHLVRNSVDHGIETPDERQSAGKPPQAELQLRAFHEAGQVIIEVIDDGRGIDHEKLKEKALDKGFLPAEQLETMSRKELIRLIFQPGFSTAKEVTDISGRGVGMDVVNTNLTRLGGVIDVETEVGTGTTISIKLPLTLAIIPSLLVGVGSERFAIPQVNLVELVRVAAAEVATRIEKVENALVMRLRGNLLPLVHLSEVMGIEPKRVTVPESGEVITDQRQNIADRRGDGKVTNSGTGERRVRTDRRYHTESAINIVVVAAGDMHYGLIVDRLLDSEEIVVKPLGSTFSKLKYYAGATILGDGRVALIMDVVGISKQLELADVGTSSRRLPDDEVAGSVADTQSLLIVRNHPQEQFAIPLGLVSRIEKVEERVIETIGQRRAIQYRGGSLPVCSIEDVVNVKPREAAEQMFVVIFKLNDREVGVLVSSIIDVVDSSQEVDNQTYRQNGVFGSAIIQDEITLLLDLFGLVEQALPEMVTTIDDDSRSTNQAKTVLVVEDSKFFLNEIKNFTEAAGYNVLTAEDGVFGWELLKDRSDEIDIVLSDIEMPRMDGLELAARIRKDSRFQDLPVVALTSVAGDAAEKKGREAGMDDYLIKLDREKVLITIARLLEKGREAYVA